MTLELAFCIITRGEASGRFLGVGKTCVEVASVRYASANNLTSC